STTGSPANSTTNTTPVIAEFGLRIADCNEIRSERNMERGRPARLFLTLGRFRLRRLFSGRFRSWFGWLRFRFWFRRRFRFHFWFWNRLRRFFGGFFLFYGLLFFCFSQFCFFLNLISWFFDLPLRANP